MGAYASSPNVGDWDPALETRYYNEIKSLGYIAGLEHPFGGTLHNKDDDWFLKNIDPNWEFVFTCIPGVMGAIGKNPKFGIASDDAAGRKEAMVFMQKARDAIAKLNAHAGKKVVRAIQIHTSPNKAKASSSQAALVKSLTEMLAWDWQGAQLTIEHCDAYVEGQDPGKGFLTLKDEIAAILKVKAKTGKTVGITINWGRSAIETRGAAGVAAHIKAAKDAGVLSGLMFSGASGAESDYGVWRDSHMPPQALSKDGAGAPASLMTAQTMKDCIELAGPETLLYLGAKLGIRPRTAPLEDRMAYNREAFSILNTLLSKHYKS